MSTKILFFFTTMLLLCPSIYAEEILLEDYSGGGLFAPVDWANTFEDPEGNANSSAQEENVARIRWATKWSGLPSIGKVMNASRFKSYQVDVMVQKGQPVEEGTNFYFQLLNKVDEGFSYWEVFVPQTKIPADGKWYRVTFPMSEMATAGGDGGEPPTDFKTIYGCTCGMTYDEEGDNFKFKEARFDNVTLLTDEVESTKIELTPKSF